MSEVSERDREMAFYGRHKCIQYAFDDLSQIFAAARSEERAEFARLAQSDEMIEKIAASICGGMDPRFTDAGTLPAIIAHTRAVLAALFRETGVIS
jgi:aspartyl/asparaginyl-tRNA synthetase